MLLSKLGLGAAQFGLEGPAPDAGRAPEAEVREILAVAARAGPGRPRHRRAVRPTPRRCWARSCPGPALPRHGQGRPRRQGPRISSRPRRAPAPAGPRPGPTPSSSRSAGDLFGPTARPCGTGCKRFATKACSRAWASRPTPPTTPGLARRFKPDIIQAPASLLDQRLLVDGTLATLAEWGVEVHLRSIFLNGLLFLPPDRVPAQLRWPPRQGVCPAPGG